MITGIILASGFSKRMKRDKLLLEIKGSTIIERVIKACVESKLDKVILVYRNPMVKEIGEKYKVETIYNENAYLGQSEGMKLGIINARDSTSYMFLVGDQPFLTSELINKLIQEYKEANLPILVPYYNENRGMPMIISSIYKKELLKVEGDKGGRDIVNKYSEKVKKVYIRDETLGLDMDTPEDLVILKDL